MKRILAVGHISQEIQLFGKNLPRVNEVEIIKECKTLTSGKALNAARLMATNHYVDFLGYIGDDYQSNIVMKDFMLYDIGSSYVKKCRGYDTSKVIISNDKSTNSAISLYLGAGNMLSQIPTDIQKINISGYDLIYTTTGLPLESLYCLIEYAKSKEVPVYLDVPNKMRELDLNKLRGIQYLLPNRQEAEQILGIEIKTIQEAKNATGELRKYSPNVLITLDKDGCVTFFQTQKTPNHYATKEVKKGDSTGAGDIHRGVFVTKFLETLDAESSVVSATQIATESVEIIGVDSSIKHSIKKLRKINA